jgi:hypothetical protein
MAHLKFFAAGANPIVLVLDSHFDYENEDDGEDDSGCGSALLDYPQFLAGQSPLAH